MILYNKSIVQNRIGKYHEEIECLNKAIKLNPSFIGALSNKGATLLLLGKYEKAIESFNNILEINSNEVSAWSNKGIAFDNLGRYEEAIESFNKAVEMNPKLAEVWSNKGLAQGNLGRYEEAIESFNKAVEINSNMVEAWYNKGLTLARIEKYDEAIKCYDYALKLNPNLVQIHCNKGISLAKLGEYKKALKCFNKALKLDQEDEMSWNNKGIVLNSLERYNDAIKCYDRSLEINPNNAVGLSNKGVTLRFLGRYEEAIKCFDNAIEIDPSDDKTWYNKGIVLVNLEKYEEAIKCYDTALKINPMLAKAHGNKGILLLNIHQYDDAREELKIAKELFSEREEKNEADIARRYELWALNASELMSKLKQLDEVFLISLNSQSLSELKEKILKVSLDFEDIFEIFSDKELPLEINELLISKNICFNVFSKAIRFKSVDLKKLEDTKRVFEKWEFNTLIGAVNSLDTFIRWLKSYNNIEEVPKEIEKKLLLTLRPVYDLDGILTEKISAQIKGVPYETESSTLDTRKKPNIIYINIADTKREWIKVCLVQLDVSIEAKPPPADFGYTLKDNNKIKEKIFKALDTAKEQKVDIICFPELSFAEEWVDEIKDQYNEMIIIGGSFYDNGYNICPIIINGEYIDPPYKKCFPSPALETSRLTGRGMKSGDVLYVFQTKCGRFSVLTCIDYTAQIYRILEHEAGEGIDFVINPCYDHNIERSQSRCDLDCEDHGLSVIQVNRAPDMNHKYGKSCIIAKEHKSMLDRLINAGFKPSDGIKYKLCQLNGEEMLIADLRLRAPPVSLTLHYNGRIKLSKENIYKYEKENWSSCKISD